MRPGVGASKTRRARSGRDAVAMGAIVVVLIVVAALAFTGCKPVATSPTEAKLAGVPAGSVVASSRKGVYHRPTCELAKRIPADDVQVFPSVRDADDAMCRPCSECNPK